MNVAYAWLAEQHDAADRVLVPVLRAAEVKDWEAHMRRPAFDEWLSAPAEPVVRGGRMGAALGVAS